MRIAYILIALVVTASALGCVDKKGPDPSMKAPVSTPAPASQSDTPGSSNSLAEYDEFGLDTDISQMDPMVSELEMDMSFSEISANAFI